ncbi:hypothetical protein [Ciceribacter selenitireducens]
MSEHLPISSALLRTLPRMENRADHRLEARYHDGLETTKSVTRAHERQQASVAADRALRHARRARPTPVERTKEIERRRRWAGGSSLPPDIRGHYSEAERAALSVIADACKRRGFCDLCLDEIARLAGVSRTSVQNALRKGRGRAGAHLSVKERPQPGGKNLPNIIRIVCRSWLNWLGRSIGFKRLSTSESGVYNSLSYVLETAKRAFEGERADPLAILLQPLRALNEQRQRPDLRSTAFGSTVSGWRR